MTTHPANSFDAKYLPAVYRKICKRQGLTPRWFIRIKNYEPDFLPNDDPRPNCNPNYDVMIVGNNRRQITITAEDVFEEIS